MENESPLSDGNVRQMRIGVNCPECENKHGLEHDCTILEICALMRGGAFVGISLGFVSMHCGHEGEWYATVENIVNEVAKFDVVSGTESTGSETIQ